MSTFHHCNRHSQRSNGFPSRDGNSYQRKPGKCYVTIREIKIENVTEIVCVFNIHLRHFFIAADIFYEIYIYNIHIHLFR